MPHDPLGRIGGIRRRFFADPGSRLPRDDALAAEAEHRRSSDGFAVLALLAAFDTPLFPMHRDFLARDPHACDAGIELAAEAGGQPRMNQIANTMIADSALMVGGSVPHRSLIVPRRLEQAALVALQLTGLWALNFAGDWAVREAALPIPGNLVGMLALYALLALGVVKLAWFDLTGSFLIRHLAFFFVPITVGLMNSGPLLLAHGLAVMLVLTLSAAVGIMLAGFVSQVLLVKPWRRGGKS